MGHLSISKAWDESKAITEKDGRLIGAVALALVGFPALIGGLVAPKGLFDPAVPGWALGIGLVASIIGVAGQLAIVRLAIGPSTTVGDAITHGLKRMPIYVVAAFILFCGLILLAIPLALAVVALGLPMDEAALKASPAFGLLALVYFAVAIFFGVRMLMMSPAASAETIGPVKIIGRSWHLTSGHWWRLFGFLATFMVGAVVAMIVVGTAMGIVVDMALGPVDPLSASAAVMGLAQGIVNAAVTALLAVMLARIYVQLAGPETASVPSTGV